MSDWFSKNGASMHELANKLQPTRNYTPREVTAMLQISRQTLQGWRDQKPGPAVPRWKKLGGRILYSGADLIDWLTQ